MTGKVPRVNTDKLFSEKLFVCGYMSGYRAMFLKNIIGLLISLFNIIKIMKNIIGLLICMFHIANQNLAVGDKVANISCLNEINNQNLGKFGIVHGLLSPIMAATALSRTVCTE